MPVLRLLIISLLLDSKSSATRISACIFLMNMARFTREFVVDKESTFDSIDVVVRIVDNPEVTRQTVEADVDTAKYLSRWVKEFGPIIYTWCDFNERIAQRVSHDKFDDMVRYLQQNPEKQAQIRKNLEELRRSDISMPRTPPGSEVNTRYLKLLMSESYRQLPDSDTS